MHIRTPLLVALVLAFVAAAAICVALSLAQTVRPDLELVPWIAATGIVAVLLAAADLVLMARWYRARAARRATRVRNLERRLADALGHLAAVETELRALEGVERRVRAVELAAPKQSDRERLAAALGDAQRAAARLGELDALGTRVSSLEQTDPAEVRALEARIEELERSTVGELGAFSMSVLSLEQEKANAGDVLALIERLSELERITARAESLAALEELAVARDRDRSVELEAVAADLHELTGRVAAAAEVASLAERLTVLEHTAPDAAVVEGLTDRLRELEQVRSEDADALGLSLLELGRSKADAATLHQLNERINDLERAHARSGLEADALGSLTERLRSLDGDLTPRGAVNWTSTSAILDSFASFARLHGVPLTDILSAEQAQGRVRAAVSEGRAFDALPYVDAFPVVLEGLSIAESRSIMKVARRTGYLSRALAIARSIAARTDGGPDVDAAALHASELALYRGEIATDFALLPLAGEPTPGVVMHLVGKALPTTQTGYTLRTQYTAVAQQRVGITPVVVAQTGASDRAHEHTETYTHDGIRYYLMGGPQRGAVPWNSWLEANVLALAEVVRIVRPAVLHVHSDFVNALIAQPVARAYGIPIVNETRGFWEESWLSRTANAEGWGDVAALERRFGTPDMYALRAEREAQARSDADAVVTLARVMQRHILDVAEARSLSQPAVSLAPNAVDPREFPVMDHDPAFRERIGIEGGAMVVGYISSIVEYEGIDTLIKAMFELEATLEEAPPRDADDAADADGRPFDERVEALATRLRAADPQADGALLRSRASELLQSVPAAGKVPLRLLIVGDGAELPNLKTMAESLGVKHVTFTGRVPHEDVLDYYGSIDLFVVPRKRAAVTELVTPLKPFEAMSTGRPCVFSDVDALAEIATDSQAAELFRAGDHHDLALTVAGLIASPERLVAMGRAGADWVRTARTWDLNALSYLELYRSLGMEVEPPEGVKEIERLSSDGLDPITVLHQLATSGQPEPTGWFTITPIEQTAREVMTEGWRWGGRDPIVLEPGMDWEQATHVHRSWGTQLHSWKFLDPALQEFAVCGDEGLLRWMIDVVSDWWSAVGSHPDETSAWYDMATAVRIPRLARLLIAVAGSSLAMEGARLLPIATAHIERIARDDAFNARNNHGFFAAAATLEAAKWLSPVPGASDLKPLGESRLATMLARQFADDGGHLEHSPDYHRILLQAFESALREGLIEDPRTAEQVARAARVLGWMVQPDGRLVQFGDTPEYDVDRHQLRSVDERTSFILSDGRDGEPERQELLVLEESGYAFVRSPQPAGPGERIKSGYLALQAGFHSRAHKHADDLTFTWFDRGREIVVDAGRFGYGDLLAADAPERKLGFYYGAQERQYVEATRAHNTVEVNGEDIERRDREPYGSALRECTEDGGSFSLGAEVQHRKYRHARELVLHPNASLTVDDSIESSVGEPLDAIAWFNMAGDLDLDVADGRVVVTHPDWTARLVVSSDGELVEPVRGQESPLRGWRSLRDGELVPTWSFGFRAASAVAATIRTTMLFEH